MPPFAAVALGLQHCASSSDRQLWRPMFFEKLEIALQLLTEQTTTIARSVEATYLYATNLEHFAEWFPGVLFMESANTLGHAQRGKEYLETVAVPLRGKRKIKISVKDAQSNKVFVTEGEFPPLMPRMEMLFQATGAGSCSVTWRMLSRNKSFLFKTTLLLLFKRVMRKRAAIGMKRLQQALENPVAEPAET